MPSLRRGPRAPPELSSSITWQNCVARLQDTLHLSRISHGSPAPREPKLLINTGHLVSAHPPSLQRLSWVRSFYCFTFWEGCQRFIIKVPHIITPWKTTYGTMCLNVENQAIYWKKKIRKTDSSKQCVRYLGCGCKTCQELLPVLSFLILVPNTADSGHAVPRPGRGWCPGASQGAGQSLAIPRQKALGTTPSIRAQGSARASELRVHFSAFTSHLVHFLVPHLGLFTSFQRRRYLKRSEFAVEVLPVRRRKTLYTTLRGGFLIFLGKCGQMSDRSQSLSILIF